MKPLATPDLTPGAIVALLTGLVSNLGVIFWPGMTPEIKGAIVGVITTVVLAAFLIHDAIIRKGRASIKAAEAAAGVNPANAEGYAPPE